MKNIFITLLIILSAGVLLILSPSANRDAEGFNPWLIDDSVGSPAPDFTLKDLSGYEVTLSSYKGKHVLLNFWATWCPYCRKERAHLNALYKAYKDKGLVVISVATDRSSDKVKKFLKRKPADYINLTDAAGTASSSYNIGGLPSSILIDRDGIVKRRITGFVEWDAGGAKRIIDDFMRK